MAAWQRVFASTVLQNALPASAVETIVAQLQISDVTADTIVELRGWCKITSGATTSSIVPRIRRAGVAGAVVGDATPLTLVGAVGATATYDIEATDQPGEVASLLYVLTIVQTAATGAGVANAVKLRAVA